MRRAKKMLALIATIPDSREANIDRINMTTNHIDIHAILQSPRQFCDLETFISVAELARDNESEITTLRAQVADMRKDAARYRHIQLHGFPVKQRLCENPDKRWLAFGSEKFFFGATPSFAIDAAISGSETK